MKDENKQSPMFTVRDAEGAMIAFAIFALASLITVFLHEILLKNKGFLVAFYTIANNFPKIMSAATTLTFIEEGFDIMFQRLRDSLAREKKLKAEAKAEVYQEIEKWNTRRIEAEARGEKFTEPPPGTDKASEK